jgi:hypothetical protein
MTDILTNVVTTLNETNNERVSQMSTVNSVVSVLMNVVIAASFSISILTVAWGFVQYVWSVGDPKAVEVAQRAVYWGIIASVFAIGAVVIKVAVFATIFPSGSQFTNTSLGF